MWNRIRSLIIKELQIILRDRKTRIIIVIRRSCRFFSLPSPRRLR